MDDRELLEGFETCTLPFDEWTHEAHVRVGFLYVRDHAVDEAVRRMRSGLRAYNAVNEARVKMGYHETITRAFLLLIAAAMGSRDGDHRTEDADRFCAAHPELLDKDILLRFYSEERLFSPRAKSRFVPPDLSPLPITDP